MLWLNARHSRSAQENQALERVLTLGKIRYWALNARALLIIGHKIYISPETFATKTTKLWRNSLEERFWALNEEEFETNDELREEIIS